MTEKLTLLVNMVALVEPEKETTESRIIALRGRVSRDIEEGDVRVHGELHRGKIVHIGPQVRRVKVGQEVYFHTGRGCFRLRHGDESLLVVEEEAVLARAETPEQETMEQLMAVLDRCRL